MGEKCRGGEQIINCPPLLTPLPSAAAVLLPLAWCCRARLRPARWIHLLRSTRRLLQRAAWRAQTPRRWSTSSPRSAEMLRLVEKAVRTAVVRLVVRIAAVRLVVRIAAVRLVEKAGRAAVVRLVEKAGRRAPVVRLVEKAARRAAVVLHRRPVSRTSSIRVRSRSSSPPRIFAASSAAFYRGCTRGCARSRLSLEAGIGGQQKSTTPSLHPRHASWPPQRAQQHPPERSRCRQGRPQRAGPRPRRRLWCGSPPPLAA